MMLADVRAGGVLAGGEMVAVVVADHVVALVHVAVLVLPAAHTVQRFVRPWSVRVGGNLRSEASTITPPGKKLEKKAKLKGWEKDQKMV